MRVIVRGYDPDADPLLTPVVIRLLPQWFWAEDVPTEAVQEALTRALRARYRGRPVTVERVGHSTRFVRVSDPSSQPST